ncbi:unnamed protein product [Arabis nemorensis]|uniref:Uncharacterized protein n=1 Tax=Arabis nemorensis TaxID=586526 RepID=A0A565C593_9BRAS|nr:unnamed protein product [Arabis nemorensis]
MTSSGPDRIIKEDRVKTYVQDILKDPTWQKSSLTLEPSPVITTDLEKGKGIVFGYDKAGESKQRASRGDNEGKLLKTAIDCGNANSCKDMNLELQSGLELAIIAPSNQFYDSPTDYITASSDAGSSEKSMKRGNRSEEESRGGS